MSIKPSRKARLLTAILTAALILGTVLSGCGSSDNNKPADSKTESSSAASAIKDVTAADAVVAHSANFEIRKPIAAFLFNNTYNNRKEYAAYQGLDITKSLKEQYYNEESKITWFDVFMDETKRYIQQVLVLSEAAREDGITLDDGDLANVDLTIQNIRSAAEAVGMDFDKYILSVFGQGITEEMIREYAKMTTLTNKYYLKVYNGYTYTDADYEKYFEDNKTSYQYADFLQYNFSFSTDSEASADEAAQKAAKEKAKAYAEDLAQCKTPAEFKKYLLDYLKKNPNLSASIVTAGRELSESEKQQAIETDVENTAHSKYAYEVTSNAGKWIFDLARKENDTTVIENSNSYTVLMVTKTAYRDETISKNVRHILFTPASYKPSADSTDEAADAAALKKANEVYESWKNGEKTEDSFAELAYRFTDDTGSQQSGGLCKDVVEGQTVTEFNDWIFAPDRKPGDSGIVKTIYGYHILYFVGNGAPAWQISVDKILRKTNFDETYVELSEKYQVEYEEEALKTISEMEAQESSGTTHDESSTASTPAESQTSSASAESTAQ